MQKVTLPFNDTKEKISAAEFVAELVRQGVTFESHLMTEGVYVNMVVEFTGGY